MANIPRPMRPNKVNTLSISPFVAGWSQVSLSLHPIVNPSIENARLFQVAPSSKRTTTCNSDRIHIPLAKRINEAKTCDRKCGSISNSHQRKESFLFVVFLWYVQHDNIFSFRLSNTNQRIRAVIQRVFFGRNKQITRLKSLSEGCFPGRTIRVVFQSTTETMTEISSSFPPR